MGQILPLMLSIPEQCSSCCGSWSRRFASDWFFTFDLKWDADFDQAEEFIKEIILKTLENPMPKGVVLNVNIPKLPKEDIKGIKVCKQANAKWEESFDERTNPHGRKYYWLTGYFNNMDESEDADETALANGYISIVPVKFDLTAYEYMNELEFCLSIKMVMNGVC